MARVPRRPSSISDTRKHQRWFVFRRYRHEMVLAIHRIASPFLIYCRCVSQEPRRIFGWIEERLVPAHQLGAYDLVYWCYSFQSTLPNVKLWNQRCATHSKVFALRNFSLGRHGRLKASSPSPRPSIVSQSERAKRYSRSFSRHAR